ncbi:MAG: hypothetical protein WA101_01345 [Minisyncoccia bacterium]
MKKYIIVSLLVAALFVGISLSVVNAVSTATTTTSTQLQKSTTVKIDVLSKNLAYMLRSQKLSTASSVVLADFISKQLRDPQSLLPSTPAPTGGLSYLIYCGEDDPCPAGGYCSNENLGNNPNLLDLCREKGTNTLMQ